MSQFQCVRPSSQTGYWSELLLSSQRPQTSRSYAVLAPVSRCYSPLQGRLPTCYSPVRRCTQGIAPLFSLDLHVLGTPPALILSQDQTLKIT